MLNCFSLLNNEQCSCSGLYLQFPSVAVSVHVVFDGEDAVDGAASAVVTLSLLLQVGLEHNVSLWTQTDTHQYDL